MKIKQAQSTDTVSRLLKDHAQTEAPSTLTDEAFKFAVGFDLSAGTVDEAADRALSAVARKLDKALSVEFTVNELIAEATDIANLANMYAGEC